MQKFNLVSTNPTTSIRNQQSEAVDGAEVAAAVDRLRIHFGEVDFMDPTQRSDDTAQQVTPSADWAA